MLSGSLQIFTLWFCGFSSLSTCGFCICLVSCQKTSLPVYHKHLIKHQIPVANLNSTTQAVCSALHFWTRVDLRCCRTLDLVQVLVYSGSKPGFRILILSLIPDKKAVCVLLLTFLLPTGSKKVTLLKKRCASCHFSIINGKN